MGVIKLHGYSHNTPSFSASLPPSLRCFGSPPGVPPKGMQAARARGTCGDRANFQEGRHADGDQHREGYVFPPSLPPFLSPK